jgi:hypothetical protein
MHTKAYVSKSKYYAHMHVMINLKLHFSFAIQEFDKPEHTYAWTEP